MSFKIKFVGWWAPPSMDVRRRCPAFRILWEGRPDTLVQVLLSRSGAAMLSSELGVDDKEDGDPIVDRALLRFGIRRIEQGLTNGAFQGEGTPEVHEVRISSEEISALVPLAADKECDYQVRDGRDLYCSAAAKSDETALGTIGTRILAPTSRPLCLNCGLPDTDYVCSHLLHPQVTAIALQGAVAARQLAGALCDAGRPEIETPVACRPGGHGCWTKLVEPRVATSAPGVPPEALPEALDYLDTAWRLCFEARPLLRLVGVSEPGGLTLPCSSRADLEARLSDLDDVIKGLDVPDELLVEQEASTIPRDHSLSRLAACLKARLDETEHRELNEAVTSLRAINRMRVGFQHSGAAQELPTQFAALGLGYPPTDWGRVWETVRAEATQSLRKLAHLVRRLAVSEGFPV